jgi:dUTP pyrophosphatase
MQFKIKLGPKGIMPARASAADVGYDLTLVERRHDLMWGGDIEVYGTHVHLQPVSDDYYFEIVPRSSMAKSPYILANSVGVLDPHYTGEILIALRKIDFTRPSLDLPARLVQLVPRRRHEVTFIEEALADTARGAGGFGSTGK